MSLNLLKVNLSLWTAVYYRQLSINKIIRDRSLYPKDVKLAYIKHDHLCCNADTWIGASLSISRRLIISLLH